MAIPIPRRTPTAQTALKDDDWEDEDDDGDDNADDDDCSFSESEYDYHNSASGSVDLDSASDSSAFTEKATELCCQEHVDRLVRTSSAGGTRTDHRTGQSSEVTKVHSGTQESSIHQ